MASKKNTYSSNNLQKINRPSSRSPDSTQNINEMSLKARLNELRQLNSGNKKQSDTEKKSYDRLGDQSSNTLNKESRQLGSITSQKINSSLTNTISKNKNKSQQNISSNKKLQTINLNTKSGHVSNKTITENNNKENPENFKNQFLKFSKDTRKDSSIQFSNDGDIIYVI